jgi:PEP-CTERM/exosortase A-associated glycosyltransferase
VRTSYPLAKGFWQRPYLHEIYLMRWIASALRRRIRLVHPDILHAHSPVLNGWPAYFVAKRASLPFVYEVRAFWEDAAVHHRICRENSMRYRVSKWLETLLMRCADQVVTLSQTMRSEIIARGINEEKVHVVPNAVDAGRFIAAPPRTDLIAKYQLEGRKVIGFIGSFYHYEGLDILIRSFEKIYAQYSDARLLLVGDGYERQNLEARANESPACSAIIFTGTIRASEVIDYYGLMDILVYPRRSMRLTELVCSLKPLEAMALTKCVVGSDIGGMTEFITPGETGLLFRPDDVEDLSRVLCMLIAAPEWSRKLGIHARKTVLQNWDWARVINRYREVYQIAGLHQQKSATRRLKLGTGHAKRVSPETA